MITHSGYRSGGTNVTPYVGGVTKIGIANFLIETASAERLSSRKRAAAMEAFRTVKANMTRPELLAYANSNEAVRYGVVVDETA